VRLELVTESEVELVIGVKDITDTVGSRAAR